MAAQEAGEASSADDVGAPHEPAVRAAWLLHVLRFAGAAALVGIAAVHLQQYFGADEIDTVSVIGPLFLVNAAAALAIALVLAVRGGTTVALAGIGLSAGALGALAYSLSLPLFGFMDIYRTAVFVAIGVEAVAILVLAGCVVVGRAQRT